jgi:hypothetical protein
MSDVRYLLQLGLGKDTEPSDRFLITIHHIIIRHPSRTNFNLGRV